MDAARSHDGGDILDGDRVGYAVQVVQLHMVGTESGRGSVQVGADLMAQLLAVGRTADAELR
ncbi:hypothetical protein, partial [Streptomyces sp. SD15]